MEYNEAYNRTFIRCVWTMHDSMRCPCMVLLIGFDMLRSKYLSARMFAAADAGSSSLSPDGPRVSSTSRGSSRTTRAKPSSILSRASSSARKSRNWILSRSSVLKWRKSSARNWRIGAYAHSLTNWTLTSRTCRKNTARAERSRKATKPQTRQPSAAVA